ncbi:MAG TPA: two-component regulator propeller domain-containing protein, partial [Candidatus Paceibacterota bacterium]|nr:two-component regulator propeller domain-containing protein [Candidatus Paceibacterota bacterium]
MSKIRLAFVVALLLLSSVFTQPARASRTILPPNSPFIVDVWGIEDGLPQSSIFSIVQTYDGYLWLGTYQGLVRFDGLKFTVFDESNTPGLNSSRIAHLFEDTRSNLWVCTENAGVSLIEKQGRVQSFDIASGIAGGRFSVGEDTNDAVWIATGTGFIGIFQDGKMNVRLAGCNILAAEKSGTVWLGTEDRMISLAKASAGTSAFLVEHEIPAGHLDFLLASRSGGYWRFADGRIQKWKGDQREKDFGSYPWPATSPVMAACEDRDGNLIVGTYGSGVYWFLPNKQVIHLAGELSHSSVLSVLVDREGNLWVGTNGGGLNRVKRKVFETLAASEGYVVQSVAEDKQGGLWIGYNGKSRVDYHSGETNRTFTMLPDPKLAANCDVKSVF